MKEPISASLLFSQSQCTIRFVHREELLEISGRSKVQVPHTGGTSSRVQLQVNLSSFATVYTLYSSTAYKQCLPCCVRSFWKREEIQGVGRGNILSCWDLKIPALASSQKRNVDIYKHNVALSFDLC